MSDPKQKTRRKFYMNDATQKKILLGFTVVPVVSLVVLLVIIVLYAERFVADLIAADVEVASVRPLLIALGVFVLVSTTVTFYQALKHSQRIAGPARNIVSTLRRISTGERHLRINLRNEDYLGDVASEINTLLDSTTTSHPVEKQPEEIRA